MELEPTYYTASVHINSAKFCLSTE